EAGERTVDETRIGGAERLVVDAEAGRDAGAEAFEQDVGLAGEATEEVSPFGRLEIERHAPLVAREERDAGAEGVPGRRDHEDVHPEVGEQRRAERSRQLPGQVE